MGKVVPIRPRDDGHARIHVLRRDDGSWEVFQVSRSESSAACLRHFNEEDRDAAVAFALSKLPDYAPCRLGRIDE